MKANMPSFVKLAKNGFMSFTTKIYRFFDEICGPSGMSILNTLTYREAIVLFDQESFGSD